MGRDDVVELATVEDLERFFADFAGPARTFVHAGVEVALERRERPGTGGTAGRLGLASVGGLFGGPAAGAGLAGRGGSMAGLYADLTLPAPVPSDLLMRTKDRPAQGEESLDACFEIEASDRAALDTYLAAGLGERLIRLNRAHVVEMNAERLIVGPFATGPGDFARDLADLIADLPRPSAEAPELPDFDEAVARDGGGVEVARRTGQVDAELARAALAGEGIPSRTIGTGGGVFAAAFDAAIRIVVPASFAERAHAILNETENAQTAKADGGDGGGGDGSKGDSGDDGTR